MTSFTGSQRQFAGGGLRVLCSGLLLALMILLSPGGSLAQSAESNVPADASAAELEQLVDTLENDAERQAFVQRLKSLMEAKKAVDGPKGEAAPQTLRSELMQLISARMNAVTRQLSQAAGAFALLPETVLAGVETLADPEARNRWLLIAAQLIAVVIAGTIAERIATRIMTRPRRRLVPKQEAGLVVTSLLLAGRIVIDAIPIAALGAAAWAVVAALGLTSTSSLVAVTIINALLVSRVVNLVARALLTPNTPELRLLSITNDAAQYLYRWTRRVALTAIYGYFALQAARLMGLNTGAYASLLKLLGLIIAGMLIVVILQNRQRVAAWLGGKARAEGQVASLRRRIADLWHLLAIVYVLAAFAVWALGIQGGFPFLVKATVLTLVIGVIARGVHMALSRLYDKGVDLAPDLETTYPGLEERLNRYIPLVRRITNVVVLAVSAVLILQAWSLDILAVFQTELGQQAVSALISVAIVVVLAMVIWEVVNSLLERLNKRALREGVSAKRSARVQTLLPMLRNAFRVVLVTIAALIALSEIGVDIGPLLAGAGVIGLAIGFGSQSLVKDVITGVFLLAEDSIGIGDWVSAGGHSGEIENLTIRTMTLRDLNGQVHVVPFGEVTSIVNMSRDYGQAVIDVGVAYREDTDEVTAMLQEVGREMRKDPEWGPKIIGDMEVFGVNDLGDSAVTIRVRMKTGVLLHWGVRREFLRRTKKLFDQRGVEIPFPHQTLYFGQDKDGTAPAANISVQQAQAADATTATTKQPTQTTSDAPASAASATE